MNILINAKLKEVYLINNFIDKIKYRNKEIKLYKNKTIFNTFLSNKNDYLVINSKNAITHIYRNIPKFKIINTYEEKENTSILVLPNNTSINLKIGDVLNFNN